MTLETIKGRLRDRDRGHGEYVTVRELIEVVEALEDQMAEQAASAQSQIDADTAEVSQEETDLAASRAQLQAEIDNMQAQIDAGTPVTQSSLDALKAALDTHDTSVKAVGGLTPTPPAPAGGDTGGGTPPADGGGTPPADGGGAAPTS